MPSNDVDLFNNVKAWPIVEARRILKKINNTVPEKGYVLFATGYGPSGWPHMGTFGEVVRTNFVRFAFSQLAPHIPTRLFIISDDLDGLRKIPENVPDREKLKNYIDFPLTSVPDPFGKAESFGDYMNSKLKEFLDHFGFEYEFISAKKFYRSGEFNEYLTKAAERYNKLMDIMLPTLGPERRATYSPFMPIDPDTGKIVSKGVISIQPKEGTITYKNQEGEVKTSSFLNGGAKLQWKCDFGVRWAAMGVDYEIYGKDHYPNEPVYRAICKAMGVEPPVNFFYEHFLDKDGVKLSKSKGNEGVSMDEWVNNAPVETMAYYMYQKPQTAKRLYFDIVPKMVDEYIQHLNAYQEQSQEQKYDNPLFFVHSGKVPAYSSTLSFSLLLNLASACNAENEDIMWGFINKYKKGDAASGNEFMKIMVKNAVYHYQHYIKPNKVYHIPTAPQAEALSKLLEQLSNLTPKSDDEDLSTAIQNIIYSIGNDFKFVMKDWFTALYQILLGTNSGPRVGSFMALYGTENSKQLIREALSREMTNDYFQINNQEIFSNNYLSLEEFNTAYKKYNHIIKDIALDKNIETLFSHSFANNLDEIDKWAQEIITNFPDGQEIKTIVIIGIGGSSLALQAFYEVLLLKKLAINMVFMENLDSDSINNNFAKLDLKETLFISITKSGDTLETIFQSWYIAGLLEKTLTKSQISKQFFVITESNKIDPSQPREIITFSAHYNIKVYPWSDAISGRFSAFTSSSLLPLKLLGVDIKEIKKALHTAVKPYYNPRYQDIKEGDTLTKFVLAPFNGALINYLLYKKGFINIIMMPYSDHLNKFSLWMRQLWAESVGKGGKGSTPMNAIGTVDQHSILQLFLDGHKDKFFNLFCIEASASSAKVINTAASEIIRGKECQVILEKICGVMHNNLIKYGCPARLFSIKSLDIGHLTALMGYFMLETIYFVYLINADNNLQINPFDQPKVELFKDSMIDVIKKM